MQKLQKLEAIRGLAAIYVLFYHIYGQCYPTASIMVGDYNILRLLLYGNQAVMIFFILSGFVIHYSFSQAKDRSFKLFFFKRFTRIFIPLFIVFVCTAVLQLYQDRELTGFAPIRLIGNLLMLQDYGGRDGIICQPLFQNEPLWSLSYEWWYYMLFFVVATNITKYNKPRMVYAAVIIATISYPFFPFFLNRWIIFLIIWWTGKEIAELKLNNKSISFTNLALPLLVTFITCIYLGVTNTLYEQGVLGKSTIYEFTMLKHVLIIMTIALVWHKIGWKIFDFTIGPFKIFASISYTVYISHYFLIIQASYFDFIENQYLRYSLYIIICLAFSYIVERILYPRVNSALRKLIFSDKKSPQAS